jgi:hypothetical protein
VWTVAAIGAAFGVSIRVRVTYWRCWLRGMVAFAAGAARWRVCARAPRCAASFCRQQNIARMNRARRHLKHQTAPATYRASRATAFIWRK